MLQTQEPCGVCRALGTGSHVFLFSLPHRCILWQLRQTDQVCWLLWEVSAPTDALPVLPRVLLSLQLCLPELHFPEWVWLWGWGQRRCAQDAESPSGITGSQRGRWKGKWIWKAMMEWWSMSHWPEGLVRNCTQVHAGTEHLSKPGLAWCSVLLRRSNWVVCCL